jgi:hypothetical protein
MKPDWNSPNCPSWANYLAKDANGDWFWYETEPQMGEIGWGVDNGRHCHAGNGYWHNTLEERPATKSSFDYHAEGIQE